MTANNETKPLFRVTFSRITGKDAEGRDILGKPKEIGAIWPRKGNKTGGLLNFDILPIELTQRQGVVFILPVGDNQSEFPY